MAELSYFFDSSGPGVNFYTSTQVADWLYQALGRPAGGVMAGLDNQIAPTTSGSLNSTYNTGVAVFVGRLYKNTASKALTHTAPTSGFRRIDSVVVRFDNTTLLAANLTIIAGVQKNDGSQVAPSINAGTDVLIATVLIDNSAGANVTTVTDARSWSNIAFAGASSPFTFPATSGPNTLLVNSTVNPFVVNLPTATGSGIRIRIVNTTALATGLVKILPNTGDKLGPLSANVACYLQNVDQSGWNFQEQFIDFIDSKSGQWAIAGGQFMPEPGSVDAAGSQYFLGKLRHLPLNNASSRQIGSFSSPPTGGTYSSAVQVTGLFGVPLGAKAVRVKGSMSISASANTQISANLIFSDNNSVSGVSIGTSHPGVFLVGSSYTAGAYLSNAFEIDIPLNSNGQFFYTANSLLNCVAGNVAFNVTAVGYYMGD